MIDAKKGAKFRPADGSASGILHLKHFHAAFAQEKAQKLAYMGFVPLIGRECKVELLY